MNRVTKQQALRRIEDGDRLLRADYGKGYFERDGALVSARTINALLDGGYVYQAKPSFGAEYQSVFRAHVR